MVAVDDDNTFTATDYTSYDGRENDSPYSDTPGSENRPVQLIDGLTYEPERAGFGTLPHSPGHRSDSDPGEAGLRNPERIQRNGQSDRPAGRIYGMHRSDHRGHRRGRAARAQNPGDSRCMQFVRPTRRTARKTWATTKSLAYGGAMVGAIPGGALEGADAGKFIDRQAAAIPGRSSFRQAPPTTKTQWADANERLQHLRGNHKGC